MDRLASARASLGAFLAAVFSVSPPPATPPGRDRFTDRLADYLPLRLALWVAVVVWIFPGYLSDPFFLAEWMDDHQFVSWEESDRKTLLQFHQIPLWNPYWCGGTLGTGAPEDPFWGPDFLLRLVFGVAHGRRLATLLLLVMGLEGTYRLVRKLGGSAVGGAFAGIAFASSDRLVGFIHDGWVNFLGMLLVPWLLLAFYEGLERRGPRFWGGAILAWILLSAGTYPTPFALLFLGFVTVAATLRSLDDVFAKRPGEPAWRPLAVTMTIGVVAGLLTVVKVVPMLAYLRQFPRVFTPVEANAMATLLAGFWAKYYAVVLLAVLGAVTMHAGAGTFLAAAVLFFALAMGDFGHGSPFHLLKRLPLFSQLRIPDRYMVMTLLATAVAAGIGVTVLEDAVTKIGLALVRLVRRDWRWERVAEWTLTLAGAALAFVLVEPYALEMATGTKVKPHGMYVQAPAQPFEQPFRQARGNRRDAHVYPSANLGSMYCVSGIPVPESPALRADLPQEEYAKDPATATVKRLDWSPLAIRLEVDAKAPATVRVNQNWSPHWTSDVGTVRADDRLLAVDVPPGHHVLTLRFRDWTTYLCLVVSATTLLLLVKAAASYFWRRARDAYAAFDGLPLWPWS